MALPRSSNEVCFPGDRLVANSWVLCRRRGEELFRHDPNCHKKFIAASDLCFVRVSRTAGQWDNLGYQGHDTDNFELCVHNLIAAPGTAKKKVIRGRGKYGHHGRTCGAKLRIPAVLWSLWRLDSGHGSSAFATRGYGTTKNGAHKRGRRTLNPGYEAGVFSLIAQSDLSLPAKTRHSVTLAWSDFEMHLPGQSEATALEDTEVDQRCPAATHWSMLSKSANAELCVWICLVY